MSNNVPQVEKEITWGFTEEEIEHRWAISERFHVVSRLFGSSDDSNNKARPASEGPASTIDQDRTLSLLERLLPEQGDPE